MIFIPFFIKKMSMIFGGIGSFNSLLYFKNDYDHWDNDHRHIPCFDGVNKSISNSTNHDQLRATRDLIRVTSRNFDEQVMMILDCQIKIEFQDVITQYDQLTCKNAHSTLQLIHHVVLDSISKLRNITTHCLSL